MNINAPNHKANADTVQHTTPLAGSSLGKFNVIMYYKPIPHKYTRTAEIIPSKTLAQRIRMSKLILAIFLKLVTVLLTNTKASIIDL